MPTSSCLLIAVCLLSVPANAIDEIHNPAEPPAIEIWRLREVWRLDNEENEDLPLMGVVNQAVVAADGHVFLLDHQMAHILEISPEGNYVQTLSRHGQGPGELENPFTLFLAEDGRLALVQFFPGKLVYLNRDGTPGGSLTAEGENPMFSWVNEGGGNLVVQGRTMGNDEGGRTVNTSYLSSYDRQGKRGHTYLEARSVAQYDPPVSDETQGWFPNRRWAVAGDGAVLIAPDREAYRIEWYAPEGDLLRVMNRDAEVHKRTDEERKFALDHMRMWSGGRELDPRKIIFDTEPALQGLQVQRDGSIWVRSYYHRRDLPDDIACRYDVFDAEGGLRAEVRIDHPIDYEADMFMPLNDGRFLLYRNVRSVLDAMYAGVESDPDENAKKLAELDEEDLVLQVILLERDPER